MSCVAHRFIDVDDDDWVPLTQPSEMARCFRLPMLAKLEDDDVEGAAERDPALAIVRCFRVPGGGGRAAFPLGHQGWLSIRWFGVSTTSSMPTRLPKALRLFNS
jgi:hypothetical protein